MSSLREKLKALEELQQIDLELDEVRTALAGVPAKRAAAEARTVEARKAYDAEKARLEQNERERRQIDTLLAMERDKVKKWEGRLGEIRTPREYAAMSREVDIAKKANEAQGEQLRALVAAGQEIARVLEAKGEQLAEIEDQAAGALEQLTADVARLEERKAGAEVRRADAATRVEPALLAKYEGIKRRRAGIAVAQVIGATCKGCHRNIPPQLSIVLARANSIETCPNCNRIIYSTAAVNPPAPNPA